MKKIVASVFFLVLFINGFIFAQSTFINDEDSSVEFFIETEQGFISIINHSIQIGDPGSLFNYRTQGGQEILFPFERYTVGATLFDAHRISYTYQPLEIITNVTFRGDIEIDGVTFTSGTPMELKYGFPFYRVTYTYDIFKDDPNRVLGLGGALQIRNASITFKSLDGSLLTTSQNLGLVPALALYSRYEFPFGLILTAEATGIYASSAFINGADFEFEGSILDASLRMGYRMRNGSELFGNIRFFGGTANGISEYDDSFWTKSQEDFTSNSIASLTISFGATLK